MDEFELLKLMNDIDDEHIEVSLEKAKHEQRRINKRNRVKWTSCVAYLAVVVLSLQFVFSASPFGSSIVYPDQNAVCVEKNTTCFVIDKLYTYESLAQEAELIFVADVIDIKESDESVPYFRKAKLSMVEVLKGDLSEGDVLWIYDNCRYKNVTSNGGPMLENGNRVLLFLTPSRAKIDGKSLNIYTYVKGIPSLGKFFLDRDGKYHESLTYSEWFTPKACETTWDRLFEDYTPKTLEEIKHLMNLS